MGARDLGLCNDGLGPGLIITGLDLYLEILILVFNTYLDFTSLVP